MPQLAVQLALQLPWFRPPFQHLQMLLWWTPPPITPLSKGILLRIRLAPHIPYAPATMWLLGLHHPVKVHFRPYTALVQVSI